MLCFTIYFHSTMANAGAKPDVTVIERYHLATEKIEKPATVVASLSTYIAYGALAAKAKELKQAEMVKTIMHAPA
jgi:hypothetical protein